MQYRFYLHSQISSRQMKCRMQKSASVDLLKATGIKITPGRNAISIFCTSEVKNHHSASQYLGNFLQLPSQKASSVANLVGAKKVRSGANNINCAHAHSQNQRHTFARLLFLINFTRVLLSLYIKSSWRLSSRDFAPFFCSSDCWRRHRSLRCLYTPNNSVVRGGRENKSENSYTVCLQTIRWWKKFLMRSAARESDWWCKEKPRAEGETRRHQFLWTPAEAIFLLSD